MDRHRWGNFVVLYPLSQIDPLGQCKLPPSSGVKVGPGTVLAPTLNRSIGVYSSAKWGQVEDELSALPDLRHEAGLLVDLVRSNAIQARIDQLNRVWIPEFLRRLANLDEHVLLVSASDHLEIWNPERWHAQRTKAEPRRRSHVVA